MAELVLPRVAVVASFVAAARDADADTHPRLGWEAADAAQRDPAGFVESLLADARERAPRPAGWVPSTVLWWVDGERYLGRLQIRHRLTDWLRQEGGHVGYFVVAGHRRQGHATAMLQAALPVAFELGLECLLVTCDRGNVASRRVIEAAGGLACGEHAGKLRFWLPTVPITS